MEFEWLTCASGSGRETLDQTKLSELSRLPYLLPELFEKPRLQSEVLEVAGRELIPRSWNSIGFPEGKRR
jgi:hypothetical protein